MYADDLTLMSDTSAGLRSFLDEVNKQGVLDDVKFNPRKSTIMIFNETQDPTKSSNKFILNEAEIPTSNETS